MDEQNDVQGWFLGMPYDLRQPTANRFKRRWWNPSDERIWTPKAVGWGYALNLYEVGRRLRLLD